MFTWIPLHHRSCVSLCFVDFCGSFEWQFVAWSKWIEMGWNGVKCGGSHSHPHCIGCRSLELRQLSPVFLQAERWGEMGEMGGPGWPSLRPLSLHGAFIWHLSSELLKCEGWYAMPCITRLQYSTVMFRSYGTKLHGITNGTCNNELSQVFAILCFLPCNQGCQEAILFPLLCNFVHVNKSPGHRTLGFQWRSQ